MSASRRRREHTTAWDSPPLPPARRSRLRRFAAGSIMVPALFLPAALASASSTLISALPERLATASDTVDPDALGANGRIPEALRPSPDVIRGAADPEALTGAGPPIDVPRGPLGIPEPMLAAYVEGAKQLDDTTPGCGVHWSVLASIGRIESAHARSGNIDVNGTTVSAILGPRLNGGPGIAAISDTDNGYLDGDPVWDRAVGPMQFIPSTWRNYAADGNGDLLASPHNVHDAVTAAGNYLCASGTNLRDSENLAAAVFTYNQSDSYVREVLIWADAYARGVTPTPAELAPEDERDVLAGARLPEQPAVLAQPQGPAPPLPPPPAGTGPLPPPPPDGGTLPPPPGEDPMPPPPGEDPQLPPPGENPEPSPVPPPPPLPDFPSPPDQPPPEEDPEPSPVPPPQPSPDFPPPPPSDQPPPPSDEPAPPSDEPAPPSDEPAPPSDEPAPPSDEVPPPHGPSPTPPPSTPPPPTAPPPPPETPEPPPTTTPPPVEDMPVVVCDPAVIDEGRFLLEPEPPGTPIPAGSTPAEAALPGSWVYVDDPASSGQLAQCEIPAG